MHSLEDGGQLARWTGRMDTVAEWRKGPFLLRKKEGRGGKEVLSLRLRFRKWGVAALRDEVDEEDGDQQEGPEALFTDSHSS